MGKGQATGIITQSIRDLGRTASLTETAEAIAKQTPPRSTTAAGSTANAQARESGNIPPTPVITRASLRMERGMGRGSNSLREITLVGGRKT